MKKTLHSRWLWPLWYRSQSGRLAGMGNDVNQAGRATRRAHYEAVVLGMPEVISRVPPCAFEQHGPHRARPFAKRIRQKLGG